MSKKELEKWKPVLERVFGKRLGKVIAVEAEKDGHLRFVMKGLSEVQRKELLKIIASGELFRFRE